MIVLLKFVMSGNVSGLAHGDLYIFGNGKILPSIRNGQSEKTVGYNNDAFC